MFEPFSFALFLARSKKYSFSFFIPLLALLNLSANAQPSGEILYQQCAVCHGEQGQGHDTLNAPALAGQDAKYLLRQLKHFSEGIRGKAELAAPMVAIAQGLNKVDTATLASYIQSMPMPDIKSNITGDLKNGSRYYQAKCGACHGGQAQGNQIFNAPRLASQSSKYLQQQMQDFVRAKRGTEQQDKFGRQMAMMAKTATGQQLTDILFYISKQQPDSAK